MWGEGGSGSKIECTWVNMVYGGGAVRHVYSLLKSLSAFYYFDQVQLNASDPQQIVQTSGLLQALTKDYITLSSGDVDHAAQVLTSLVVAVNASQSINHTDWLQVSLVVVTSVSKSKTRRYHKKSYMETNIIEYSHSNENSQVLFCRYSEFRVNKH